MPPTHRLGVDIGGTFTDLVVVEEATGAVRVGKLLTTPKDPAQAKEFTRVLLDDMATYDPEAAREEHVRVARRLAAEHPEVGAIVLECTNMPPYRADVQRATGLPVFDIVSLVRMVHHALVHGLPPLGPA